MDSPLTVALLITALGMGLVFATILLLWLVMAVLVRVTAGQTQAGQIEKKASELEQMQRAAIAAVTIAMARQADHQPHEFPLPPTALVSAWQGVMRTRMLNKRGPTR